MAFTEFYCDAASGSNLNGGAPIGGAYPITYTNGGWDSGTGVFTPASGNPITAGVTVGDYASVYVDGAAAPTGFVGQVTARDATTITVNVSSSFTGTAPSTSATARTIKVGGAWLGPNGTSGFPFNFITNAIRTDSSTYPRVNFKSGTNYAITAGMTHTTTARNRVTFQGYTTTVGDGGRATIDGGTSGASYVLLSVTSNIINLLDLIFQNNGASGSAAGITFSGTGYLRRVVVNSVRGRGIDCSAGGHGVHVECETYACNQSNTANLGGYYTDANASYIRCIAHDNTGSNAVGWFIEQSGGDNCVTITNCIADSNGSHGVSIAGNGIVAISGLTAYGNGGSGISNAIGSADSAYFENSVFVSNAAYGINSSSTSVSEFVHNCAFYNNTSGETNGVFFASGSITLTGVPFADAANGDFDLDATASEGAACRGAGRGSFTQTASSYTGTLGYPDIGAAQHQDAGGGGGSVAFPVLGRLIG